MTEQKVGAKRGHVAPRSSGLHPMWAKWLVLRLREQFGGGDADDLAQETHLRLAQVPPQGVRHPKALLMTVAMNAARDQMRRRAARGGAAVVSWEDVGPGEEPGVSGGQDEVVLLKQIILSMPALYRDVFLLSRFQGLTYGEIAVRLDLSVKTVEWRMSKALAWCEARLRD